MEILNLIICEVIKILKKKITLIFVISIVIGIIFSCIIVSQKNFELMGQNNTQKNINKYEFDLSLKISDANRNIVNATSYQKNLLDELINKYNEVLENGIEKYYNASYKEKVLNTYITTYYKLLYIDVEKDKKQYEDISQKCNKLWNIFENGEFEDFIEYEISEINESYENGIIGKDEYESQITKEKEILKYEIGKSFSTKDEWKEIVLNNAKNHENMLKIGVDTRYTFQMVYLEGKYKEEIENQIKIDMYRLDNNIPPAYLDSQYINDEKGYLRNKFDEMSTGISAFLIGIFAIIISASTVSEEVLSGTIKFLLIVPTKRYKILIAKIVSIFIIITMLIIIISQLCSILGYLLYGNNYYLYVKNGNVMQMNSNLFVLLNFLLKLPELLIYILLGVCFSTTIRNTAVSNVITTLVFSISRFITMINRRTSNI